MTISQAKRVTELLMLAGAVPNRPVIRETIADDPEEKRK